MAGEVMASKFLSRERKSGHAGRCEKQIAALTFLRRERHPNKKIFGWQAVLRLALQGARENP